MPKEELDPSVQEFKQFINQYPTLCTDIHLNKVDLQMLYEKWVTDGEEDAYWDMYKTNNYNRVNEGSPSMPQADPQAKNSDDPGKPDLMKTIMQLTKNMDMTKVQKHVEQISEAVLSVQEVVHQFNQKKQKDVPSGTNREHDGHFFQWMKD